ncbi:MarR family transcriptional regulator [Demequina sp. SYSU T00068]|uniref:MarR family transcriptional regulator n=1 Tax=Demequina lignilytica TaxID=3051663 RepID=UPI0026197F54|nr:MarR family transcriptional regulator [Demequina sp. SYSU T00068]MDN4489244.1 MarR family transcriptional regulator [Demequina sp. SYSU T00068]
MLNDANELVARVSLDDAVEQDLPFFIRVERDVLAADFDKPGALADATDLYFRLRLAGHPAVLCTSGAYENRSPRCHVFAVIDADAERRRWSEEAKSLRADVRNEIRPPWVLHRSGTARSTPMRGIAEEEVLHRLSGEEPVQPLNAASLAFIADGVGDSGDRSADIFRATVILIEHGWPQWEVLFLLQHSDTWLARRYGEALDRRNHPGDTWFARYVWPDAVQRASTERERHLSRVRRLRTLRLRQLLGDAQHRATRATDVKVLELFLQRVEDVMQWDITMASRTLQDDANIGSPTTATAALQRLRDRGLIRRSRQSRVVDPRLRARTFRVLSAADEDLDGLPETPRLEFLFDDVFRQGKGDGPGAGLTYCLLLASEGGCTVEELASRLHADRRTIHRHIDRLLESGLVRLEGDRYAVTGLTPYPGMFAEATIARQDARRRHEHERDSWRSRQ